MIKVEYCYHRVTSHELRHFAKEHASNCQEGALHCYSSLPKLCWAATTCFLSLTLIWGEAKGRVCGCLRVCWNLALCRLRVERGFLNARLHVWVFPSKALFLQTFQRVYRCWWRNDSTRSWPTLHSPLLDLIWIVLNQKMRNPYHFPTTMGAVHPLSGEIRRNIGTSKASPTVWNQSVIPSPLSSTIQKQLHQEVNLQLATTSSSLAFLFALARFAQLFHWHSFCSILDCLLVSELNIRRAVIMFTLSRCSNIMPAQQSQVKYILLSLIINTVCSLLGYIRILLK
jgi:hypothetical protein